MEPDLSWEMIKMYGNAVWSPKTPNLYTVTNQRLWLTHYYQNRSRKISTVKYLPAGAVIPFSRLCRNYGSFFYNCEREERYVSSDTESKYLPHPPPIAHIHNFRSQPWMIPEVEWTYHHIINRKNV